MQLKPVKNTSSLEISGLPEIGNLMLAVPEAIQSNTGASGVYPVGREWVRSGDKLIQKVSGMDAFGPGNCYRVDEETLECCGIKFPVDNPVTWETALIAEEGNLRFTIRLTNVGDSIIKKAGAAICLHFLNPQWWADENVFVFSEGKVKSLSELGRDAGFPNGFQAYLLKGQAYEHVFYHEFWGFNQHRLDKPIMVSEYAEVNLCVGVVADSAYFLLSNKGNPCTDLMLAFGNISPGATVESGGNIWIKQGKAVELVAQ